MMASIQNNFQTTEAPAPGVYRNVPDQEYRSWRAWNWSTINDLTPKHVSERLESGGDQPSGATVFGSLVHSIMLEPGVFDPDAYTVVDKIRDKSERGRAFTWSSSAADYAWAAENVGPNPIPLGGVEDLRRAVEPFTTNPVSKALLNGTPRDCRELSLVWKCPEFGLLMKARLDFYVPASAELVGMDDGPWIGDIKTTRRMTAHGFARDVYAHSYHAQLAHYVEGWRQCRKHLEGYVEPRAFYMVHYKDDKRVPEVQVLPMPDQYLEMGEAHRQLAVERLAESVASGEWPGRPHVEELPIPASALSLYTDGMETGGA